MQNICSILDLKKASDIIILNLHKSTDFCHFFIICTAESSVHAKALSDALKDKTSPWHIEGYEFGHWVLLDYLDIVVHIFLKEEREYYRLEELWGDVPKSNFPISSK